MNQSVTVFAVPDASCDRCRQTIEGELHDQPGVSDVHVDLPGKVVRVAHDAEAAPAAVLADRLERSGYPVAGSSEVQ